MAQQKKKQTTGFEIGFDALPYLSQLGDDIPGFRKDWEVFFKSSMEHGGFRVKFSHQNRPIHERKQFKVVHVTDACVDGTDFKNIRKPYDFYFLNLGYEAKIPTKWFDITGGADVNFSRYKSETLVNKVDCKGEVGGVQYGWEGLWKILDDSNYSGIGATPFVGIKVPFLKRFRLTFETGLQFNMRLGDYKYLLADLDEGYYSARGFEINWGTLTNDIGISYTFGK